MFINVSIITQFISVHKCIYPVSCVWSSMSIKVYVHIQGPKTSSRLGMSLSLVAIITSGKLKMSLRSMCGGAGVYSGVGCS